MPKTLKNSIAVLLLAAMAGCSSGNKDPDTDTPTNPVGAPAPTDPPQTGPDPVEQEEPGDQEPEPQTPNTDSKPIVIDPHPSGGVAAQIFGAATVLADLDQGELFYPEPEAPHLVLVESETGEVLWMALAEPGMSQLTLGAHSSALAMITVFPAITALYAEFPSEVKDIILTDGEFLDLEARLLSTPDWFDFEDEDLVREYLEAVASIMEAINKRAETGTFEPVLSSITAEGETENAGKVQVQVVHLPADQEARQSGVELLVTDEPSVSDESPSFETKFHNHFARWVKIAIGIREHNSALKGRLQQDEVTDSFMLPPDDFFLLDQLEATEEIRTYNSDDLGTADLLITAVGPGLRGGLITEPGHERDYLIEAGVYTLLSEVVPPVVNIYAGLEGGAGGCVIREIDPLQDGAGIVANAVKDTELRDHLLKDEYAAGSLRLLNIAMLELATGALDCLALKAGGKLILKMLARPDSLLAKIKLAYTLGENAPKIAAPIYSWTASKNIESWILKNRADSLLDIDGLEDFQANSGQANYTKRENLNEEERMLFDGNCIATENRFCEGYSYQKEPPYKAAFKVACKHPLTGAQVPCRRVKFTPNALSPVAIMEHVASSNGTINFDYGYQRPGEYKGIFEIVDSSGGITKRFVDLQIKLEPIPLQAGETIVTWSTAPPYDYGLPGAMFQTDTTGGCELVEDTEGYGTKNCQVIDTNIILGGPAWRTEYHGTRAGNSITIVGFPHLSTPSGDKPKEDVSSFFHGAVGDGLGQSFVSPGVYLVSGIEFTAQRSGNLEGSNEYLVVGNLTVNDDGSCIFVSSEGSGDCRIAGNEIRGVGAASGIRGTISESQLTFHFHSIDGPEIVAGYFSGSRIQ